MPAFHLRIDTPIRGRSLPYIEEPGELISSFDDFCRKLDWETPPLQCLFIDPDAGTVTDVTGDVADFFGQLSFDLECYRTDKWSGFFDKHKAAWADEETLADIQADRAAWQRHRASFARPRA